MPWIFRGDSYYITPPVGPGFLTVKETLNTVLEVMCVGEMYRAHGHMNALARLTRPTTD